LKQHFQQSVLDQFYSESVQHKELLPFLLKDATCAYHCVYCSNTQDKNQLIIEAGFGLGESIVSGQITPDSYVIDKRDWSITDINVNEQKKGLFRKNQRGNEWKILGEKGKKQVLDKEKIIELSKLIVKIEKHYGFPVDVEWAKEKDKFYITQSRPITTLTNLEEDEEKEKIKLSKLFTREHSLIYANIWGNSDVISQGIKNILFIKDKGTNKISIWFFCAMSW